MRLAYVVCTPDVKPSPDVLGMCGNLHECFEQLAELGYDGVELSIAEPDSVAQRIGEIRELARRTGLEVAAISTREMSRQSGYELAAEDQERSEQAFRSALTVARELGCCIGVGRLRGRVAGSADEALVLARGIGSIFATAADWAINAGVYLCLEPIAPPEMNWICDTATALNVVIRVNRPAFRLLLDTAYMHAADPPDSSLLERAAPFVRHVHLADDDHAVPGSGSYDFAGFLSALRKAGYSRWLSVECFADDHVAAAGAAMRHLSGILRADG